MKCPKCNYENKDDALYCGLCYEVLKKGESKTNPTSPIKTKSTKWKELLLLGLILFFLIITLWTIVIPYFRVKIETSRRIERIEKEKAIKRAEFSPYTGETDVIKINTADNLSGLTKEEFINFRKNKVQEYSFLNIFPKNYNPQKTVFGQVSFGVNWVEGVPFYICNPYLLIILSCKDHTRPLDYYFKDRANIKIKYTNRIIEEIYEKDEALNWFNVLYSYDDYPGIIRIWMPNASDAGLIFACVDRSKTVNVDFDWNEQTTNITNSAYLGREFFHVGKYNVNNLSPSDARAHLKLIEKNRYTCIYVKLWVVEPKDINQKEDFVYIIKIIP